MNTKFKTICIATTLMTGLAVLPSCSLFNKTSGGDKVKKEAVLPQDREQIQKQATLKTYNPAELAKGLVAGDWAIEEVYGKKAVGEVPPFLKFDVNDKIVYGNNGCNALTGSYQFNPNDSTFSFGDIATTMRVCTKRDITDYDITSAMNVVRRYSWKSEGDLIYIYLRDSNGQDVMTLIHQNFDFLNGTWRVVTIGDEAVNVPDMKLVIDVDEGKVHGNTGCNILNGSFEINMDSPNSISFQALATTRMMCPDIKYETELLVALEAASHAKPIEAGKVLFLDDQNQVVLTLVRTSDK